MRQWLAEVWPRNNGTYTSFLAGRQGMQEDGWSCGLQMLETLHFILQRGGGDDLWKASAHSHMLTAEAMNAWRLAFEAHEKQVTKAE